MKLELIEPTKPFVITQAWGVDNPAYKPFGFTKHNGVDFRLGKDAKLFAPHDGEVTKIAWQEQGAGLYLCIRTWEPVAFPDGKFYAESTLMHLAATSAQVGQQVLAGDEVAVADNTGFSTGPHTHWRLQRLKLEGRRFVHADRNQAQNSVDPVQYIAKASAPKFTRNLWVGVDHPEVRELQRFLNRKGFTVAPSGAGSPGKETTYFGEKTRVALAMYQATNKLMPPSGYLGPITRLFMQQDG